MKAAAYARYSTDKQTENSIAYQMSEIQKYCNQNNITLCAFFSDEASSGTNTERQGFENMVAAANRKEFDAVIIYDISRGSRDVGDWFAFRKEMLRINIQVISATQRLGDITNPSDFITELISVGLGQHQVLDTRKKSIDGVAIKAKAGVFLGGLAPLGYDIVGGDYVINPHESQAVHTIFSMYASGCSYNKIIDALGGFRGKRGQLLGKNSLNSILQNERYIGVYTWNKKKMKLFRKWAGGQLNPNCVRIENCIPPIIDMETWERVQRRMKDNRRNPAFKAKRNYLLSGLIECDCCGSAFVGHASTNSRGYETRYYICGDKYRTRSCACKNINADKIETFVVQNLKEYLLKADFEEIAKRIANQINNASPDLSVEKAELTEITRKINNGVQAVLSGANIPELETEIDRLRIRKDELEDIIAQNSASTKKVDPKTIVALFEKTVDSWSGDTLPQIVKQHVTRIYAHKDGSFSVNVGVHMNGCGGRT